MVRTLSGFLLLGAAALPACSQESPHPVRQTLDVLWDYQQQGRPPDRQIAFEFPEPVVNLYLALSLKLKPRPGLKSLAVELLPDNRIVATAEIDYDLLFREDPALIPSKLRAGAARADPVRAEFHFSIHSGTVTFTVKPISSGDANMPAAVLRKIVRRIAAMQPEKIDASRPLPVAFGLKRLYTARGLLGGATY